MRQKAKIWLGVGAAVVAVGGVVSLVQDQDDGKGDPEAKPKAVASAPASSAADPAASTAVSGIPRPDAGQTARLVAGLREVHPGLVVKEDRAVSRARSTCADIVQAKEPAVVLKNARLRFSGGNVSLDDAQADRVVKAVEAAFCH
ncbi:hypothetical protein [Streptomyces huiliensis]|uniref:hypothetical protein n=1 Tax=Streptomyces huiliensis TaxID=2876027 RepID=UPI001CBAC4A7|nr:hypothetical protein [Streptomyces huiliensis]MBZ4324390.1 hypothetical protein [Streptomyces huiliensis]